MINVAKFNSGYKYLFCCIDIYSRYSWVRLLKSKTAEQCLIAFKDILKSAGDKPLFVLSDKGSEIQNKLFHTFCKQENIKLIVNQSTYKAPFVERFQRSLQRIVYTYCTDKGTYQFFDKIQDFVLQYNTRKHRMIGMSPQEAELNENQAKLADMNEKYLSKFTTLTKSKPKYKLGQTVRIRKERDHFFKGYKPRFKDELFKISEIRTRLPIPMYVLKTLDDQETIIGSFYQNELALSNQEEHRIANVLKTKGGKSFVSWTGYPQRYNSWIPSSSIKKFSKPK